MSPDFSQNPTNPAPVAVGSQLPTGLSKKRTVNALDSNTIPKFGIPLNPKVHVSQETRHVQVPSAAVGGPPWAAVVRPKLSVPAAATSRREASQAFREHFAQVQNNIQQSVSQAEPEETPIEPPPIQHQGLPLDPAVLDRINSYGSISIS